MMLYSDKKKYSTLLFILIIFHVIFNMIWHRLNTAPPTWDSAGHLVLSYIFTDKWEALFNGTATYQDFLKTSVYYPPFVHILGSFFILMFGRNYEYPILTGTFFLIIAISYLYVLIVKKSGNYKLAFVTTLIFSLIPQVWEQSRHFHLDVPLVALLLGAYFHLTFSNKLTDRKNSLLFFIFFTLAQLTKWYAFIYLVLPFIYEIIYPSYKKGDLLNKQRLANVVLGSIIVLVGAVPWYITNYGTILENTRIASTADAGDPTLVLSYESIFHYLKLMTSHQLGFISLVLLAISIYFFNKNGHQKSKYLFALLSFPYIVFTLIQNKDLRYILPLTPIIAFYIAYLLVEVPSKLSSKIRIFLYTAYLLVLYFFLSFNQMTILEGPFSIISYLMAGPYYQSWNMEPTGYSINTKNWRNDEIIKKIDAVAKEDRSKAGLYNVLELSDNRYYSIASLDLYKVQNGFHDMVLSVPYNRLNPFTPDELKQYLDTMKLALVPVTPGPPGLRNIDVLNQLTSYFNQPNSEFELVETYDMPDGNRLSLYKRFSNQSFVNPYLREDSLKLYASDVLVLDMEKIKGTKVTLSVFKSEGVPENILIDSSQNSQKRISLEGVQRFKLSLPLDMQDIQDLKGWRLENGDFYVRDQQYFIQKDQSGNTYRYENLRLDLRNKFSSELKSVVEVSYAGDRISVKLLDAAQTAYVAYATTEWQWTTANLDAGNSSLEIPINGLFQLEVSQKSQLIQGFPSDWAFFACYNGDAVCFYPLVEGL